MYSKPQWLPGMVQVNPWTADTHETLYAIFRRDFVDSRPRYRRGEVWLFPQKENGKEVIFWHLTSREVKPKPIPRRKRKFATTIAQPAQRYPDPQRSERLPWVRPIIENPDKPEVLAWDYKEGGGTIKTYVWLKDYDFVVIMKKYRSGTRRLITSFCVDKSYKRRDFERKYTNRIT
ncbi:MAG: hypothetical protein K8S55_00630 [Phycisphaerae bacterium]|nr:hypothetical protein [Phycisphaerae bacterium]